MGDRQAGGGPGEHGRRRHEAEDARRPSKRRCKAVRNGQYHDQFQVDWYQGGAGTSTNMNANEVLANIALEMIGT